MRLIIVVFLLSLLVISCKEKSSPIEAEEISREAYIAKVVDLPTDFSNKTKIETLQSANEKLVGSWFGIVNTPWIKPYHIVFKYYENHNYSCYNITHSEDPYPGFYYGIDEDSPIKTIELNNILTNGTIEGEIIILFSNENTNIFEISGLSFFNNDNNLKFNLSNGNNTGKIEVSLFKLHN